MNGWLLQLNVHGLLEPFRVLSDIVIPFDGLTRVIVLVITFALLVVAFKAFKRNPTPRLKWVGIAFFLFAVKWVLKVLDLFVSPGAFFAATSENVFELFILGSLFIALFSKK